MTTVFRRLSALLFVAALGAVITLLTGDAVNGLRSTALHQSTGALAFLLIGASFISLQLGSGAPLSAVYKQILLGVAFVLWGGEQFISASRWATVMDSLVVLIFVADLSLIITANLKRTDCVTTAPTRSADRTANLKNDLGL